MIRIEAKGLHERLDMLNDFERNQMPFAVALALTQTAKHVEQRLISEMRTVFDRPTRWTLNSLRVFPATKQKLVARVWMKDEADGGGIPPTRWLTPHVYSGGREDKRSEKLLRAKGILPDGKYIVPGRDAKLDSFGNIGRGQIQKIMSGLGAQQDTYANSTKSRRSVGNLKRFFVMRRGREAIGIAERTSKSNIKMVLAFVSRPGYRKDFDFFGIADREAEGQLPIQFELALARALETARR